MKISRSARALILAGAVPLLMAGQACRRQEGTSVPKSVQYIGKITEPALREASGVAMSHRYPGVFWTHNDSNNPEVLYAITRNGTLLGKWRLLGTRLADWEDITYDTDGNLLLADIGDNRLWRRMVRVHRVREPDPKECEGTLTVDQTWYLTYPKGPRNAEAIFVLGTSAYLITKCMSGPAEVYRFSLAPTTKTNVLEWVADLKAGPKVTSAALSPDAKILAVITSTGASAYYLGGDVSRLSQASPLHVTKFRNRRIEGCTFTPDGLLAVSETRHMYLFTNVIFRLQSSREDSVHRTAMHAAVD
jgi:hypothetical protein